MGDEMLTTTELTARLEKARERERRARAATARLQRQMVVTDRRLAAQQKITLGAALLRAIEHEPRHTDALRRLLAPHIVRPTDQQCLRGTPFEIALADVPAVAAPARESVGEA
jgi:hypothetical protein